jgi:hypothetical protein
MFPRDAVDCCEKRVHSTEYMETRDLGTYDFYFDMADDLEKLGVEFSLTVAHGDGVIVLSNVQQAAVARHMLAAQTKTFRDRFSPSPDQGNADEDSMDPEI